MTPLLRSFRQQCKETPVSVLEAVCESGTTVSLSAPRTLASGPRTLPELFKWLREQND